MEFKKSALEDFLVVRVRGVKNWDRTHTNNYAYFVVKGDELINYGNSISLNLFDENLRGVSNNLSIDGIYFSEGKDLDCFLDEKYLKLIVSRDVSPVKKVEIELTEREMELIVSWLGEMDIDDTKFVIRRTNNEKLRGMEEEVDKALLVLCSILTDTVDKWQGGEVKWEE